MTHGKFLYAVITALLSSVAASSNRCEREMPSQLFVGPLSFDTSTSRTSKLFECIKLCFHVNGFILLPEKTLSIRGLVSYELPSTCASHTLCGPDVHAHINTLFPLFLHNDFTRPWPCSNEVWRFCDATGWLMRGTLLSILVHLLQFLPALTQ